LNRNVVFASSVPFGMLLPRWHAEGGAPPRAALYVSDVAVRKRRITTTFFIEPTEYGWAVRIGDERLGLFMTQRQALTDVDRRRSELAETGHRSTVVVTAQPSPPSYPQRLAGRFKGKRVDV
jgi:hypothetical protein